MQFWPFLTWGGHPNANLALLNYGCNPNAKGPKVLQVERLTRDTANTLPKHLLGAQNWLGSWVGTS